MDAKEETLTMLNRIWLKLNNLPKAGPLEQSGFFVVLGFILMVLLMVVLTCISCGCCCCCCRKAKNKGPNV